MASSRKKQEDKNLKTLRELVTLSGNRQCFDCYQRGPTYVNMTIGSFVCTRCSGILRGLTPPHRVKSISMATFTAEEIELIRSKGNDKCTVTWLGLCQNPSNVPELKDEQQLKEYLSDKYEKKRFYLEESSVKDSSSANSSVSDIKPAEKPKQTDNFFSSDFEADFSSADIFNSVQTNNNNSKHSNQNNNDVNGQMSFANFDNNVIYNAGISGQSSSMNNIKSYNDLFNGHTDAFGSSQSFNNLKMVNQASPPAFQANFGNENKFQTNFGNDNNKFQATFPNMNGMNMNMNNAPPPEDKYAALKDLELSLKNQQEPNDSIWNSKDTSNNKWESEFNHSAFERKTTVTNPFSLKQTSVQNIWSSPQSAVENINPFKNEVNNKMTNNMNNTSNNLFDMDTKWGNSNVPMNAFNQSAFGMSNFENGIHNGKSEFGNGQSWATANPFSPTQVMSNNPFL